MLTRRKMLQQSAGLLPFVQPAWLLMMRDQADKNKKYFKIGACDWSLGKSADPTAFELAKQIGLDGIMVNMGSKANELHLRKSSIQEEYKRAALKTGVRISSIAIGELNNVPYKSEPETEQWVWDSVDVAKSLGVPVVLLAFFVKNDLRNDEPGMQEVIKRLRKVMPHAEKNGILLGIESYLSADDHIRIIEAVGSPNLKVYYDFRNTADAGYDTIKEFRKLASHLVCELHMKENGFLLGQGTLNWNDIGESVYSSNYFGDGWMQIEWAKPENIDIIDAYKHNLKFLRSIFGKPV